MTIRPPKLYVIADRGVFRSDEEWLNATRAVAGHLSKIEGSALQIRVKGSSAESRSNRMLQAREAVDEALSSGLTVLANTTLEEALALEFSGWLSVPFLAPWPPPLRPAASLSGR